MTTLVCLTDAQAARLRAVADAARLKDSEAIPVCLDALFVGFAWDNEDHLRLHVLDAARQADQRGDSNPFWGRS